MAVIPSFQSGAKQPDLAGAYLGGRRTSIAEEQMRGELALGGARIAQAAAEAQNRIALGQQELQARRIQNEMELMAQRETQERNHLRQQQEAEILRSYRETQIGMEERRLKIAEAQEAQRIKEAATLFDREQRFNKKTAEYEAAGFPRSEAQQRAFLDTSYGQPGYATAIEALGRGGPKPESAADRNLRYKILQSQKEDALIKYGLRSPEYESAVKDIDRQIGQLFQQRMVPPESSPYGNPKNTTPIPMSAPPAWQGPIQPRVFMGTPSGEDATGFPISTPAWQGPNIIPDPAWQGPLPQEFTMHGRGGQTVSGLDFSNSSTISTPPTVTTKAQFDALKSGAVYIGKNGKRFQKP